MSQAAKWVVTSLDSAGRASRSEAMAWAHWMTQAERSMVSDLNILHLSPVLRREKDRARSRPVTDSRSIPAEEISDSVIPLVKDPPLSLRLRRRASRPSTSSPSPTVSDWRPASPVGNGTTAVAPSRGFPATTVGTPICPYHLRAPQGSPTGSASWCYVPECGDGCVRVPDLTAG